jgi:hypothetical protein
MFNILRSISYKRSNHFLNSRFTRLHSAFTTSAKMPITELVFIRPKPDTQLRKELDAKLGGTSEDTHQQDEMCLFLREFT